MLPIVQTKLELQASAESASPSASRKPMWVGWIALLVLPAAAFAVRSRLAPWSFMWAISLAIFFGCKWQTWWARRRISRQPLGRTLGYLFAWPGMEAETFFDLTRYVTKPKWNEWMWALTKMGCGCALLWGAVRRIPGNNILAGWIGMIGMILVLHFGAFHLLSLAWRSFGVDARAIMQSPLSAKSLGDFWGRRWNLGFRQLTHEFVFQPMRSRVGAMPALLLAFLISGIIHDLVISVPAGGGYGLPTLYFVLQGCGLLFERSSLGKTLGLGLGAQGRIFAMACAGCPAVILFHPAFVLRVILPFLNVIGAR
jgi:Membrane bound O-acyl transferase family